MQFLRAKKRNQVKMWGDKEIPAAVTPTILFSWAKKSEIRSECMRWINLTCSCCSHVAIFVGKKAKLGQDMGRKRDTCKYYPYGTQRSLIWALYHVCCYPMVHFSWANKQNQVKIWHGKDRHNSSKKITRQLENGPHYSSRRCSKMTVTTAPKRCPNSIFSSTRPHQPGLIDRAFSTKLH